MTEATYIFTEHWRAWARYLIYNNLDKWGVLTLAEIQRLAKVYADEYAVFCAVEKIVRR